MFEVAIRLGMRDAVRDVGRATDGGTSIGSSEMARSEKARSEKARSEKARSEKATVHGPTGSYVGAR
jgi:hypothetical protein